MNVPLLIFSLAEGKTLHFPLTWHSDRLALMFTDIDSFKWTVSLEMTSFAIYGISHAPFLWKKSSITCPARRERAISVQSSLGILFQRWSSGLNSLGLSYPSESWHFFLLDCSVCPLPLFLILRTFPHVSFLNLSIKLFFPKVKTCFCSVCKIVQIKAMFEWLF